MTLDRHAHDGEIEDSHTRVPPQPTDRFMRRRGQGTIRSRHVVVGETLAHVLEAGRGAPLLLLPSAFLQGRTYVPTILTLSSSFQVFAVELPGTGGSSRITHPWTFTDYADWVPRLLDALKLKAVLVVGHSQSGAVGLLTAARYQERVTALVLADSVGAPGGTTWLRLIGGRFLDQGAEFQFFVWSLPDIVSNTWKHPANFFRQLSACRNTDLAVEAEWVKVPTLLAWGLRDHTTPLAGAVQFRERIAGSRLHVIHGSHDWLVTHPEEFAEAVVRFSRNPGLAR
ncbi:MAG: alpha/beta hydrolase [Isosphaeraceae bacterium]